MLLYAHGGGWVIGDLETHDAVCRTLCHHSGAVVVAVDYRLAPEHPFPAAPDDVEAALRWVAANAREIGADAARLGVAGDSAGATLVAVAAQRVAGAVPLRAAGLIYPGVQHVGEASASYVEHGEGKFLCANDAVKKAQAARVTVYGLAVGGLMGVSLSGESTLRQLTSRSGGRVFFPWRDIEFPGIAKQVADDAHNRYLITYIPSNQKKDGSWRTISLEVPEGHKVQARSGYRAPAPSPIRPTLEFHATRREGGYVELASSDLEVLEDGVPQKIDTFHEALDPVSIVLTLDASGSMVKAADSVRQTAREFVSAVPKEDRLALITFSDEPRFEHVLSADRKQTLAGIDKYTPVGGTALYDAIWDSLLHLKKEKGRRAIGVLSDGRDENNPGTAPGSAHTFEEVLELTREVGAAVFEVGLGPKIDTAVLERLTALSGGQVYFSADVEQLGTQFARIIENLRQRYVVSYSSTNFDRNGEWRAVEIRARKPGLIVTSTAGYRAPAE